MQKGIIVQLIGIYSNHPEMMKICLLLAIIKLFMNGFIG